MTAGDVAVDVEDSSWGYIRDDLMADSDRRAAIVHQRRLYLAAQMKKRGVEPTGEVIVTQLDEKAHEAPPGCSGYRFALAHRASGTGAS